MLGIYQYEIGKIAFADITPIGDLKTIGYAVAHFFHDFFDGFFAFHHEAAIGAGLSGLGAGIVLPLVGAAKSFADAGSVLNDASARTGVSVEALSALSYAAQQTGTDLGTVEGAIRKMQKALVAGSEENLQAEATFMALGLSVQDLMKLNPDQQFDALAKAILSMEALGNVREMTALTVKA